MHDKPLVSICITCFNSQATIERAIRSALDQDWSNKEIIVVDDCSSDNSVWLIKKWQKEHERITFFRHDKNAGYAAALNTFFRHARGELFAFFDDDDCSRPDRLDKQWRRIVDYEEKTGAECVLCYANRAVVPIGSKTPQMETLAIGRTAPEPHGPAVADYLLLLVEPEPFVWGQFGSCTLMMRRGVVEKLGPFDARFRRGAEWDFAIRAAMANAHFIAVNESLILQYLTAGFANREKSGHIVLSSALELRWKHQALLKGRRLMTASVSQAHARYHYARGNRFLHVAFTAIAIALAPRTILPHVVSKSRILKRLAG